MYTDILQKWLAIQCSSIPGAHSGVVTLPAHGSQKSVVVRWPEKGQGLKPLLNAAFAALEHHKPLIQVSRQTSSDGSSPTVVATPVRLADQRPGAASLSLENADTDQGKAALQMLSQSIPALGQLFQTTVANDEKRPELEMVTGLLATSLTHKRFKACVTAVATELATLLDCERVSIGLRQSMRTRLVGLSHNAEIKTRQDLVRTLSTVMDEAIDQAASVQLPENPSRAPRITLAHRKFREQFNAGMICTVPLFFAQEPVGALLLERPADQPFTQQTVETCEHLASFLAPVLQMKFRADQPWPKRLFARLFSRKKITTKIMLTMLLAGLTLASLPIARFQVSAPAQLESTMQRVLTAPDDGYIKQIYIRPGDMVSEGQIMVELEDQDLLLEQRKLQGEMAQFESSYGAALASRDRARLAITAAEIEKNQAYLGLVEQKLARIQLRAPFDGIVIQGDLSQALGAPVKRGDTLITLAPAADYRVSFDVDERDIGYLDIGQTGRLALSANPSERYSIEIERITPLAAVKEGRNIFAAEARITDGTSAQFRPGLKGLVKVEVERRSPLWVALHRSWNWITFKLWSWTGYA